ncbi:3-oxoacyl-[acyl-carrier-protein] synthase III C-terminal domain-containing protein [Nocardiopsis sp. NPDC055551]
MAYLSSPQYVLGEITEPYDAIKGWRERVEDLQMTPAPEIWGWGRIRRTEHEISDLAVASGRATIERAGIETDEIDELYLCSTAFPTSLESQADLVARVVRGLGLRRASVTGIGLTRCANLLMALRAACAAVDSGQARTTLVITTDRIEYEPHRIEDFALFSDGAASCVVTADEPGDGFRFGAAAAAQDFTAAEPSRRISADLAVEVNERLRRATGVEPVDVDRLLHNNLYLPIVSLKELQAGFAPEQLYLDNVTRFGHCFAADPLINLTDLDEAGELRDGGAYLLASSVPGIRTALLLHRHV